MSSRTLLNGQYSVSLLGCHITVIVSYSYNIILHLPNMKYFTVMLVLICIIHLQSFADLLRFYLLVSETATNCLRQGKFNTLYI